MDRQVSVSFTPGTIVMIIAMGLGLYALWQLWWLVLLVITSVVIASSVRPGVLFFMRYKLPRPLAVLAMYLIVFGTVFGVVYFFLPPILLQSENFITGLPHYLETVNVPTPFASTAQHATSFVATSPTASTGNSWVDSVLSLRQAFSDTSEGAIRLVTTVFGGIFSLFLVIVLSFYLAVQERGVEDFLRLIVPLRHEEYVVDLWHRSQHKIGLWMQGQLLLSLIVGVLVYLGLLIMGVPYALLLAIFTAMAEIIPVFGSLIAGAVAAAVAFSSGGVALAFIVIGLYVVVNQFEANLIYPLVVKKIVGVPPLLVILALIAGGEIAGFLGIVLSVPLAAIAQEFVADLDRSRRARHAAAK